MSHSCRVTSSQDITKIPWTSTDSRHEFRTRNIASKDSNVYDSHAAYIAHFVLVSVTLMVVLHSRTVVTPAAAARPRDTTPVTTATRHCLYRTSSGEDYLAVLRTKFQHSKSRPHHGTCQECRRHQGLAGLGARVGTGLARSPPRHLRQSNSTDTFDTQVQRRCTPRNETRSL